MVLEAWEDETMASTCSTSSRLRTRLRNDLDFSHLENGGFSTSRTEQGSEDTLKLPTCALRLDISPLCSYN